MFLYTFKHEPEAVSICHFTPTDDKNLHFFKSEVNFIRVIAICPSKLDLSPQFIKEGLRFESRFARETAHP